MPQNYALVAREDRKRAQAAPPGLIDLGKYASKLVLGPEGWWQSPTVADVSYPLDGNGLWFEVEDSSFWFRHRNRCILEALKLFPPQGALFDIGGGNGCVARAIQDAGWEVVLVEPGITGVRNSLRRGIRHVVRSTMEDAGILPQSLPAIGLFDVLEHVGDDDAFLKAANPLVVPGGRVYITAPAYQALWSHEDILVGHARRYTMPSLERVLRQAGYAIEFATYFFAFLPLPILLCRVLPYRLGLGARERSGAAIRSDHEVRHALAGRALHILMRRELSRIAKRKPLRFGGSCLVVASKC